MKKALNLLAAGMLLLAANSVSAQKTRYQRVIGGDKDDNNYAIDRALDGGYILTGYTTSWGSGGQDIYLVKTNGLGQVEWSKAYGTSANETGWSVKATLDSGYAICGTTGNGSNAKGFVMKTDKNGTISWQTTITGDSVADFYNITLSKFGGMYVVGYAANDSFNSDMFVAKLSQSGSVSWVRQFGSRGNEEAYAVAEDDRGYVAIVGQTTYDTITEGGRNNFFGDQDIVVAIADSLGTLKYMKNYGSTEKELGWDIKQYGRDQFAVAGWSRSLPFGDNDAFIMLIDTIGTFKTLYGFGSGGDDRVFDLEVKPDNGFILSGYMQPNGGDRDVMALNIDSKGNINGTAIIGGFGKDGHWPTDGIRTRDGGYAFLSTTESFRTGKGTDMYLIRTNEQLVSGCNGKLELVNNTQGSFSSYNFGHTDYSYTLDNPKFSTTSISGFDTTLCCQLEARVAADSVKLCEGKSVNIGREPITGYIYSWTADNSNFTSSSANPSVSPGSTTKYKLVVSSSDGKCAKDSAYIVVQVFNTIKADLVRDTAFCDGDTVTVNAYSGLNGYLWIGKTIQANTQSIRVYATDTIFFSVFDKNNCFYTDTVKVFKNSLPVFNLGKDTAICENLPITLSGPANMKSYNWNNGEASTRTFTTKTEKKHNLVVVDNNGCMFTDEIQIFTNPFSTFSLGPDTTFCSGGTFTILGPGALNGYIWNGVSNNTQNLTISQPGIYTLTAFNSFKCPYSDTIVIGTRPSPVFNMGDTVYLCYNTTKTLSGPPKMASYRWSNGPTTQTQNLSIAGKYNLKVTDSTGCSYTDTALLIQKFPPVIDLGADTIICWGDSIMLDAGAGYTAYAWSNGKNTRTIYARLEALYTVNVTDNFGCVGTDDKQVDTMKCTIGYAGLPAGMDVKIYPVPVTDKLNIEINEMPNADWHYAIIDLQGKVLMDEPVEYEKQLNLSIDMSAFPSGVYWLQLSSEKGKTGYRFIKK